MLGGKLVPYWLRTPYGTNSGLGLGAVWLLVVRGLRRGQDSFYKVFDTGQKRRCALLFNFGPGVFIHRVLGHWVVPLLYSSFFL